MKNTFKRVLVFGIVLSTGLLGIAQDDCLDFRIDSVRLEEERLYVVYFSITNLSDQDAEWISFEYPAFTFFTPSLIPENIPANGTYAGSFELWDLNLDPLMAGDILFFKAIIENQTGWCCHEDGIPLKIPGEEPECTCDNIETSVEAGFYVDFNCDQDSEILLSPKAALSCDSLIWTVYDYEKKMVLAVDTSLGKDTAALSLLTEIGYWVEMRLIRWDEDGNKCESTTELKYGEEVINCCITNLSPIVIMLRKAPKSGNSVQVNWRVQMGTNFEFFTIIRYSSQDTVILDRVKASLGKTNYSYTDASPPPGSVKYFVVGTAKDLRQVYSRTASITGRDRPAPGPITLFPNPAGPQINIRMPGEGRYQISILNWQGQSLERHLVNTPGPGSVTTLHVAHLPAGTYLLKQENEEGTIEVIKWIKK